MVEIQKLKLSTLKIPEYNPRIFPEEEMQKLIKNIETNGYLELIVVNKRNNHIVSGSHRYKALQFLGYKEIDCIVIDIDEDREKALNIAMNRIGGFFDEDKLETIIKQLNETNFDLELTGLADFELDVMLSDIEIEDSDIPEIDPDLFKDEITEDTISKAVEKAIKKEAGIIEKEDYDEDHEQYSHSDYIEITCPNCGEVIKHEK